MPDNQPNDDVVRCLSTPKPYHMSDATLQMLRDAEVSGQPLFIIDKGKSYAPNLELLKQGSTQFQFDRPTTIDPSAGQHPTAR